MSKERKKNDRPLKDFTNIVETLCVWMVVFSLDRVDEIVHSGCPSKLFLRGFKDKLFACPFLI